MRSETGSNVWVQSSHGKKGQAHTPLQHRIVKRFPQGYLDIWEFLDNEKSVRLIIQINKNETSKFLKSVLLPIPVELNFRAAPKYLLFWRKRSLDGWEQLQKQSGLSAAILLPPRALFQYLMLFLQRISPKQYEQILTLIESLFRGLWIAEDNMRSLVAAYKKVCLFNLNKIKQFVKHNIWEEQLVRDMKYRNSNIFCSFSQ